LPASPVGLLKRKVGRAMGLAGGVKLWTGVGEGKQREKAVEIVEEDGKEVGWWLVDGDWVIVEQT
jgi:hypothetical protein